jgi:predicted metal-binding membrane protein
MVTSGAMSRKYFLASMTLLVAVAWIILWTWHQSPYGRYLHYGALGSLNLDSAICRSLPPGLLRDSIVPAALFVAGWLLMIVAMMLPSSTPLLDIFRRLTRNRSDHAVLVTLLVVGYLTIWVAFSFVILALDSVIYLTAGGTIWLSSNAWLIGGAILFVAGLYQFSSLKYRCLDQCRSPLGFVMQHWRGSDEKRQAFLLGVHHGIFCVGCCWALMLLMFVVGSGSVGWMLILGAVMAVEKNFAWGRHLSLPLGLLLIGWSGVIIAAHWWLPAT